MDINLTTGSLAFLFALLSANWAMELGYSQLTQMILFCLGFVAGPLVLLFLYIRILYLHKKHGQRRRQFLGY